MCPGFVLKTTLLALVLVVAFLFSACAGSGRSGSDTSGGGSSDIGGGSTQPTAAPSQDTPVPLGESG